MVGTSCLGSESCFLIQEMKLVELSPDVDICIERERGEEVAV